MSELRVTLDGQGFLCGIMPGAEGHDVAVPLYDLAGVVRVLRGLDVAEANARRIGHDARPTEMQAQHWAKHHMFPRRGCPFCKVPEGNRTRVTRFTAERSLGNGVVVRKLVTKVSAKAKHSSMAKGAQATKLSPEDLGF